MSAAPRALRVACLAIGPDEYACAMARTLGGASEALVIASTDWSRRYADDLPPGVRLSTLPWPRHRDPRGLVLAARVVARLRRFRPDVVHFFNDNVVWLLLALPFIRRYPLVVTVHDVAHHPGDVQAQRVPMATIRVLRRAADAAIVHGEGLARALLATGLRPPAGVHVVAHPVLDRHARLAGPAARRSRPPGRRLLFFGRVMAYKGLEVLVAAADRLIERFADLEIVVAGTGPELARLAPELARRPWFTVHDAYIPDEVVAGLFDAADLVILPYIEASQSGVAALAAAFGTPVVASEVGELGELVRTTGMGLVVPPADVPALAAAIARLLDDPALTAGCAASARAVAEGPMSAAAVAARTLEVYAAACRRGDAGVAPASGGGGAISAGRNTKL